MQGEYFTYGQGAAQAASAGAASGFAYGANAAGYMPFGYAAMGQSSMMQPAMMMMQQQQQQQRSVDKFKRSNKVRSNDPYAARKYEDATNSTDESIHLVKARKTGESAPNRYETDLKKRSQSGHSLIKGSASQTESSRHHHHLRRSGSRRQQSHSEERSLSPADGGVANASSAGASQQPIGSVTESVSSAKANKLPGSSSGASKKRRDRKNRKASNYYYGESDGFPEQLYVQQTYAPQQQQAYGGAGGYGGGYPGQDSYNDYQQQQQQQYGVDPQSYYPNNGGYGGYEQQQQQQQMVAPGGPVDYSQQPYLTTQYDQYGQQYASAPTGGYGQQAPSSGIIDHGAYLQAPVENYPSQSYGQGCDNQNFVPGLPPGAKIVAEYFLGYLDEQQTQQQYQLSGNGNGNGSQVQCPPGCEPASYQQSQCPPGCEPEYQDNYRSRSSKEDVDIELWEKSKKKHHKSDSSESDVDSRKGRSKSKGDCDLSKLKDDIIRTIQNELGNLKLDGKSDTIQPIFLMPKPSEQQAAAAAKPIYIPRNIYVPVIRPVFVPRERIIVRPQIIHVARPVLVDRPVPIQQRPIVIERDRPVPVRVETIERTEPSSGGGGGTNCTGERQIETGQEVTYHEFTQTYPSTTTGVEHNTTTISNAGGASGDEYGGSGGGTALFTDERIRRKQEVMNILEEAERRKLSMHSKSNEDLVAQYKYVKYDAGADNAKTLDSMLGNTQGYTLEVLDQRVSDKFEKTDQETIKARYGVDSFQYLPAGVELTSAGSQRPTSSSNDFYNSQANNISNGGGSGGAINNGSFKSIASLSNENGGGGGGGANLNRTNNNSSSNIFNVSGNYGGADLGANASPGGSRTVHKMYSSYSTGEQVLSSSHLNADN